MGTFSAVYDARRQREFEEALKQNDLTRAKQVLESFPKGYNASEKVDYLIAMNEGYRALADKNISDSLDKQCLIGDILSRLGICDSDNLENSKAYLSMTEKLFSSLERL